MNKTYTINLNGKVYHINDDAFEKLNVYLDNLKQRFSKEEGAQEIMDDIEARIGELFSERMRYGMQVVTLLDVDDIIGIMGQPEEIEQDEAGFICDEADKKESQSENKEDEKTNAEQTVETKKVKRLFRDPDDMVIAGVCSGLGAYFKLDPWVFRAVFIITCLLGLGSPILIYVVLWIIIPEATTVAQKLQMRGEQANVENISKAINDGEAAATPKEKKSGINEVLGYIFKFIAVIFGGCLGFFVLGILFVLAISSLPFLFTDSIMFHNMMGPGMSQFSLQIGGNPVMMFIAILVAIAVPLYKIINMILVRTKNIKPITTEANWTLFVIWLISIGVILFRIF